MNEYLFDVKLSAAVRVRAQTESQARSMVHNYIDASIANFGAWPNGDPILAVVTIDGVDDPLEINGRAV